MFDWLSLWPTVHHPECSWSIWTWKRPETARPVHVPGCTRAPALCRWLECSDAAFRGERSHHCAGVLCESRVETLVVHVSPITHIVHVPRGSPEQRDQGESAEEPRTDAGSGGVTTPAQHNYGTVRAESQGPPSTGTGRSSDRVHGWDGEGDQTAGQSVHWTHTNANRGRYERWVDNI